MNIVICKNYLEMSCQVAGIVAESIREHVDLKLGLPTGETPKAMYAELVKLFREGNLDFSETVTFNLDEYVGLSSVDPNSFRCFMNENLFDHINIRSSNIHFPDGISECFEDECQAYEDSIQKAGGIGLQLLGIGRNGHIGFNEPGDFIRDITSKVNLTEDTINANARFFKTPSEVPSTAVSMGIGTIMRAKSIILMANGDSKAQAVKEAVKGPITPHLPASLLRLHPDVTFFLDREASSLLEAK